MHRAMEPETGIDDVGIGVLFELYDWRFEVMALLHHAIDLESKMGSGRIRFPSTGTGVDALCFSHHTGFLIRIFLKNDYADSSCDSLYRYDCLAQETADISVRRSTTASRRWTSSKLGIGSCEDSETSSRTPTDLYSATRGLDELVRDFAKAGFITSFCTAGYRCGRTGKCIMDLLRSGKEGKFCK